MISFKPTIPNICLAVILLTGIFTACSRSPECWGADKNKGIIIESVPNLNCFPVTDHSQYVITNDSMYRQAFTAGCNLPAIDFNTVTLLGMYTTGGCEIKFIREVSMHKEESRYHYKVKVKECGLCKKLVFGYNWVTVPKLPDNWTVTFEKK